MRRLKGLFLMVILGFGLFLAACGSEAVQPTASQEEAKTTITVL